MAVRKVTAYDTAIHGPADHKNARPRKQAIMQPIEEGSNAAGTTIGHIPRPMLGIA